MKTLILFFGVISLFLVSCKKDDVEPIKTKPVDSVRIDYQINQTSQFQSEDVLYKLYFDSNTNPNSGNITFNGSDSISNITIPITFEPGFSSAKITLTDNSPTPASYNYLIVHWIKDGEILKSDTLIKPPPSQEFSGTHASYFPI